MGEWSSFIKAGVEKQEAINKIGDDSRARMKQMDIDNKIKTLEDEASKSRREVGRVRTENEQLQDENNRLKSLLSKPFKEIAQVSGDFKVAYEQQQDLLADWILSQEAFKETAIQFGIELGKSIDEVKEIVSENEMAVLENRTEHNNNADKYPTLAERREKILKAKKSN